MDVIIVGGGIAGLSQALSLHQIGVPCRVYEAVPNLSPLGYGVNLQPNADKQACVDQYKGWTYPWLDVHGLFAATPAEHVLQLPNVDRDPIPRWSFGRVTLIGDAAHPMQPFGAQAGSQAVVDGRVLAASLMAIRDPAEALTALRKLRASMSRP